MRGIALAAPLTPTTVFVPGSSFAGQQKLTANRLMVTGRPSGILNSRVSRCMRRAGASRVGASGLVFSCSFGLAVLSVSVITHIIYLKLLQASGDICRGNRLARLQVLKPSPALLGTVGIVGLMLAGGLLRASNCGVTRCRKPSAGMAAARARGRKG